MNSQLQRDTVRAMMTKHGMYNTRTHRAWGGMRGRCNNPRHAAWKDYGGRGITVCPEWDTFAGFYKDMGECPVGKSLDRKNNALGYNKDNCRWATPIQQSNNTRSNHLLTHDGITQSVAAWARQCGLHRNTIGYRLKRGWSIQSALTTPSQKRTYSS